MSPHVVVITMHDLGRHVHALGARTVVSPSLDALIDDGVAFVSAFATAPQCSPSRAALHTGRYPHATGVLGLSQPPYDWRLNAPEHHIASVLRAHGYRTELIGLQHVTPDRSDLAFDRVAAQQPIADLAESTTRVLEDLAERDEPFYLEVGVFEPHRPWDYGGATPDDSRGADIPSYLPQVPEAVDEVTSLQGAIREMDAGIGRIIEALESTGLADDTILIVTTDHGLALPGAKSTLYDAGLETLLVLRWPHGNLSGGRRVDALTSNVDVVPTLLDLLDLPHPPWLQGVSLVPVLRGEQDEVRDVVFAEKTFHTRYEPMRGLRTRDRKVIVNFEIGSNIDVPGEVRRGALYGTLAANFAGARPHVELYDLDSDPLEQDNVAESPEHLAELRELLARLAAWMRDTNDPLIDGPVASPFAAKARALLSGLDEDRS
jgi:N-sulfoglucosamine sulfohydrolase